MTPAVSEEMVAAVAVKALEWQKSSTSDTMNRAETILGYYRVWTHHEANGEWFWSHADGFVHGVNGIANSEVEAKAAAQADYEARILSALASPSAEAAQPVAEPVEWLWYGEADGKQHISFGRWQNHKSQYRYKYADIQATEHDHHAQPQGELRDALERLDRLFAYPVSTEIKPRGWDLRPFDDEGVEYAVDIIRAALAARAAG